MTAPAWLAVIDRPFPSAVMVVIRGPRPIVIDPGSLTDADVLDGLITASGVDPHGVATVVCTHHHSDHVGAVARLRSRGARVAAHRWEGAMVNARDPQSCASAWLDQPVLPYRVDDLLAEGDEVISGEAGFEVIHTPGHTLGGISLWEPSSRTLVCGDALHAKEAPWLGVAHEGAGSAQRALQSLDRIEALDPLLIVSGHGPVISEPEKAIARTRERLARWVDDPPACAMHAAKRIFVYRLMLEPIGHDEVDAYLSEVPWVRDLAAQSGLDVDAFTHRLLESLAPVLAVEAGRLRTTAPHRPSPTPIPWELTDISRWPR
jgi:hydroxyacylglutathione hydrolase